MKDKASLGDRSYQVRAVERVCSILSLLQESVDGVSLPDLAAATDLPKSSAFRYLWTLQQYRYVERVEATGDFRLGLGFLGMQSRQLEMLRQRARPMLERLRDTCGETINLGGATSFALGPGRQRAPVKPFWPAAQGRHLLAATGGDRCRIGEPARGLH